MSNQLQRIGSGTPAAAGAERTRYLVRGTVAPRFVEAHALSAADAIAFTPAGAREGRAFAAMIGDGSIRLAAPGRYYFDMRAYEAAGASRERRLLPVLVVLSVIIAAVAVFFYRG